MGSKAPQPAPSEPSHVRTKPKRSLLARVKQATLDIIHPDNEGFRERISPKEATPENGIHFFRCTCGGVHYRHAGYVKSLLPFMRPGGEKRLNVEDMQVMVCVACRKSYVWISEQMYDVTGQLDLEAWEKFECEAQRATGPGGQC